MAVIVDVLKCAAARLC